MPFQELTPRPAIKIIRHDDARREYQLRAFSNPPFFIGVLLCFLPVVPSGRLFNKPPIVRYIVDSSVPGVPCLVPPPLRQVGFREVEPSPVLVMSTRYYPRLLLCKSNATGTIDVAQLSPFWAVVLRVLQPFHW